MLAKTVSYSNVTAFKISSQKLGNPIIVLSGKISRSGMKHIQIFVFSVVKTWIEKREKIIEI